MLNTVARQSEPWFNRFIFSHLPDAPCRERQFPEEVCTDHQFIAMLDAYQDTGGLAPAQGVVALFKRRCICNFPRLASLIANREVVSFEWQSTMWLPLFQVDDLAMTPQSRLSPVPATLSSFTHGLFATHKARFTTDLLVFLGH